MGIGFALARVNAAKPLSPLPGVCLAVALVLAVSKWPAGSGRVENGGAALYVAMELAVQVAAKDAMDAHDLPQQYAREAEAQITGYAAQPRGSKSIPQRARGLCG